MAKEQFWDRSVEYWEKFTKAGYIPNDFDGGLFSPFEEVSTESLEETLRELEVRHGEGELPFYQGARLTCFRRSGF